MIFWVSFIGAAVFAIAISLASLFVLGVIFSLIIIIAGVAKLEYDFKERNMRLLFSDMINELHLINYDLEKNHILTKETSHSLEIKLMSLEGRNGTLGRKIDTMQESLGEKVGLIEKGIRRVHKRKIYKEILNKVTDVETRMTGIYEAPVETLN